MEVEDESSIGAYYEYPFTVLGISLVVGLTMEDVSIAYNRALRHIQKQESLSLPPTRGSRVPTASQVIAALADLVATQADLNRSVIRWKNDVRSNFQHLVHTIDAHQALSTSSAINSFTSAALPPCPVSSPPKRGVCG